MSERSSSGQTNSGRGIGGEDQDWENKVVVVVSIHIYNLH